MHYQQPYQNPFEQEKQQIARISSEVGFAHGKNLAAVYGDVDRDAVGRIQAYKNGRDFLSMVRCIGQRDGYHKGMEELILVAMNYGLNLPNSALGRHNFGIHKSAYERLMARGDSLANDNFMGCAEPFRDGFMMGAKYSASHLSPKDEGLLSEARNEAVSRGGLVGAELLKEQRGAYEAENARVLRDPECVRWVGRYLASIAPPDFPRQNLASWVEDYVARLEGRRGPEEPGGGYYDQYGPSEHATKFFPDQPGAAYPRQYDQGRRVDRRR